FNIAGVVDVKKVAEYAKTLPGVVVARDYVFMCSEPGQDLIKEDIKNQNLNRVVVASCSPALHEITFRTAISEAGLNKYLLEMANIREHCSWVHHEKEKATEKAMEIVRMAVAKARYLEPLEELEVEAKKSVLVLGGGVAGIRAALELANYGFDVYIVEKSPTIGGKAALIGYIDPKTKGAEVVSKMVEKIRDCPKIQVFTSAELVQLTGSAGNYVAKLRLNPRFVNSRCTRCGECEEVCPIEVSNEYNFGLDKRKAIFIPFKNAYPPYYAIDYRVCVKCGECEKVCRYKAINLKEEAKIVELRVGAVIIATGYDPYRPFKGEYGYGLSPNVITLFQLERLLDPESPTKGELIVGNKVPKSLAFIQCVGSRGTTLGAKSYCSRMCCTTAINSAIKIKEKYPEMNVYIIYKDIMTYGSDESLYEEAGKKLINFIKFEEKIPKVTISPEGLFIDVFEYTIQQEIRIPVEAIVLSIGMLPPRDIEELIAVTRVSCGGEGFVREAHLKLAPVEAPTKGIFLAGCITGPKNILESIRMGSAAAAKAMSLLSKGKITIEPMIAQVDEERCSGCGICVAVCPYSAISIKSVNGDRIAKVEKALCMGCGTCNASCPSGAMQHLGFKDVQLLAQTVAALRGESYG
ncbi:MAG: CoB--CoM heterodisulfide reductase iron-sulfur subunit A family protein, partial [Archaeoglobaceae archaeon]